MKANPPYATDLSESGDRVYSETDDRDEEFRDTGKLLSILSPEDLADYKLGVKFITSLEVTFLIIWAVAVCYLTGVVALAITPNCIRDCLAFGMCLVLSVAGLVSGVFTLIGGGILLVRHAKKPRSWRVRLLRTIILGISVMSATLCVYLCLLEIPRHVGKHECRLIPWSP